MQGQTVCSALTGSEAYGAKSTHIVPGTSRADLPQPRGKPRPRPPPPAGQLSPSVDTITAMLALVPGSLSCHYADKRNARLRRRAGGLRALIAGRGAFV